MDRLAKDKDKDSMLGFYYYSTENWRDIRTIDSIESVFATVKFRTAKTKNCEVWIRILMIVFKLVEATQKTWLRLSGYDLLADVINVVKLVTSINL